MPLLPAVAHSAAPVLFRHGLPDMRDLPLQGVTILAVEDSRFASDALRLLCQRSGARLRRAESLEQASAHLKVYRPEVMLIDLGLPDGRGEGLIDSLAARAEPRPVLLGISGDPEGQGLALAAGADGFLEKPIASLHAFQQAILAHLPGRTRGFMAIGEVIADSAALHDDLAVLAKALRDGPDPEKRRYLAGFLGGLALQSRDKALSEASIQLADPSTSLDNLSQALGEKLHRSAPFAGSDS